MNRRRQSALNDFNACALVAVELLRQIAEAVSQLEECASAPGDDALLDGCPGGVESVFDSQLAVVQFRLGGSSDLDHRNTPGQFGDAFVQFFPVVIGVRRLQFTFDRGHAVGHRGTVIVRGNDRGGFLADGDPPCLAKIADVHSVQRHRLVFADQRSSGEDGDIRQGCLATFPKGWGTNSGDLQNAPALVHHQRCQGFALHFLGQDQQW